jgi:DNA cross-link repair 1A protein
MRLEPALQALARCRPACALMLDTTYCSPQHVFPPQAEVLTAVRDGVRAEAFNPKVLFLFGTYTIGEEQERECPYDPSPDTKYSNTCEQ